MAVTESHAGTIRIVCAGGEAVSGGVCHGMTLAEAKALLPSLRVAPDDVQANLRVLKGLAMWGQAFSPIVQVDTPDTLLLDVTGCARLFRGEANLLRQALDGLGEKGLSARGAIADTPGAAWAIGHAHRAVDVVTHPGRDVEDLLRLPVWALRVDDRAVAALASVGVETVEALMYLPRSSLGSRFGDTVLHRLDQATGNVVEPLESFQAPPVLRSHVRLGAATDRYELIREAVACVLAKFCEQLAQRVVGVTRLYLTFYCPESSPMTLTITVSTPTRSLKRLQGLLRTRLDQARLPAKTDCVMLWTREVEPLDDWQDELFDTHTSDDRELADLVDRLSLRLGTRAVARAAMVSDHQPERAFAYVGCVGGKARRDEAEGDRGGSTKEARREGSVRPLRLWGEPVEVGVVALSPDGPPAMFRFKSVEHVVASCVGPERLETGWWRGPQVRRDYFRVVSRAGEAFWIFRCRASGKWFVHGVFE